MVMVRVWKLAIYVLYVDAKGGHMTAITSKIVYH